MALEDRLGRLEDAILQLTAQIRELTDIYIGAIETGQISKLTPIAVKLRNKRKDKQSEFREYSMEDARTWFFDFHRAFGEQRAAELLKKFQVQSVTHIAEEDINRFIYTIREVMEK